MAQPCDVIIIGAGPAGSAAAITARRLGLRCALLDKARFPRDKLCGGAVTERARREMRAIFGRDIDARLFRTLHHVRFTAGDRLLGEITDAPPLHMTMRHDYDAMLRDCALAAGAEDFAGLRIAGIDTGAGQVTLTDGRVLAGRVMIGADGVNSQVARQLFGRAFDPRHIGLALELEVPGPACPGPEAVEIDFSAARWGYGWMFPKTHGVTIGVGGIQRHNDDLRRSLADYLARRGVDPDLPGVRGHFIPAGDFRARPGCGATLLAGDAAGLVDPLTGEGIAHAMTSGAAAARAAAAALAQGTPDRALDHYCRALAPLHRELRTARRLRAGVFPAPVHRQFLRVVATQPAMQRRFLALLSGDRDYSDVRRFFFLRLARRMLAAALPGRRRA